MNLLGYIDRFGVRAVLGRDELSAGEIYRMLSTENIVNAYRSRKASDNWGKWAQDFPRQARMLADIEVELNKDE